MRFSPTEQRVIVASCSMLVQNITSLGASKCLAAALPCLHHAFYGFISTVHLHRAAVISVSAFSSRSSPLPATHGGSKVDSRYRGRLHIQRHYNKNIIAEVQRNQNQGLDVLFQTCVLEIGQIFEKAPGLPQLTFS